MPVLDAQPPSAAHSTTIPKFRIFGCFPRPGRSYSHNQRSRASGGARRTPIGAQIGGMPRLGERVDYDPPIVAGRGKRGQDRVWATT
jgi:hypothetical protein